MWQEINIDFKRKLEKYLKNNIEICDYSFTNLYLWSFGDRLKYREDDGLIYIAGDYLYENEYFMPLAESGKLEDVKRGVDILLDQGHEINFVTEEFFNKFNEKYIFVEMSDNFDYVYTVEDLIHLKGRKYSKKKNKLNQFLKSYNYEYKKMTLESIPEVEKFQKIWCVKKNCESSENLRSENMGLEKLFKNFDKTSIAGGILYVDGKIVAYTIGEKLTDNMVVIHIEKADELYNGSYQAINQLFIKNEWSDFQFVNREDDSGIAGIRQAKESYFPIKKIKKYIIKSKNESCN